MNNTHYLDSKAALIKAEIPRKITSWGSLLIITFISIILFGTYYKYHKYLKYTGNVVKDNEKYLIKIVVEEDEILNIKKGILILNNKELEHEIFYIKPVYYLEDQNQKYYEVFVKCNLEKAYQYENLPITVKFKLPETTLMKEVLKKLRKR